MTPSTHARSTSISSRTRRGALRAAKHAALLRRLSITLGAFVLVAAILSIDANGFAATTYLFNGSSTLASWNTSVSWLPNNGVDYPGTQPGDTAILDNGGTANVNSTLPNHLATLSVTAGSTITLNSTSGDAITVGGLFTFDGGTVNGPGSMAIGAPALLNFSSSGNTFLGATINNAGRIDYQPIQGASLSLDTSAAIHNSGSFNLLNDAPIG